MSIKIVKGNIIDALVNQDVDIFAHGVNCKGVFGSGLAGEIARRLPKVRNEYLYKHRSSGWGLGKTQIVKIQTETLDKEGSPYSQSSFIMNCATQKDYGRNPQSQPNNMYCSYEAIRQCMYEYHGYCKEYNLVAGLPYIGCGLAGGDWNIVSKIIEEEFEDMTIIVYQL